MWCHNAESREIMWDSFPHKKSSAKCQTCARCCSFGGGVRCTVHCGGLDFGVDTARELGNHSADGRRGRRERTGETERERPATTFTWQRKAQNHTVSVSTQSIASTASVERCKNTLILTGSNQIGSHLWFTHLEMLECLIYLITAWQAAKCGSVSQT